MIEFKKNYSEDFTYYKTGELVFYDEDNMELEMYGPDVDLLIAAPRMAEIMMERAKELDQIINAIRANGMFRSTKQEEDKLQTILSILKDAGVEVVG